jgi:GH35 family endo-1,4-beta-xylanase
MFFHPTTSRRIIACVRALLLLACLSTSLPGANLLHHWTFDEGSGSLVTDSVGSANMSINGSSTGWTNGRSGGAFTFDGSNNARTTTNDSVTNPSSSVAITGWFKTANNTAGIRTLFQIENKYGMQISNSGRLQLSFNRIGNVGGSPQWGDPVDDGLWHHFVAQNNGTTTQLYIDGVLIGSRAEILSSLSNQSRASALGARLSNLNSFAGSLDDIRYYDAALTQSEISALAQISNVPPVAQTDSYTVAMNTPLIVGSPGVLANDSEADGDEITAVLVADVASGNLSLSADGSFTYDPPTGFFGLIEFTYQAVDIDGASNTVAVELTVLSSLSPEEVNQIESDLGITLSQQEILDLSAIVKPQSLPQWRSDANLRIEENRKADLTVSVVDTAGSPISGATVNVELKKNAFKFGGVATVMDLTDGRGDFTGDLDVAGWQQIFKSMFNSVGFNNAFKPKITGQHQYIPNFMSWAAENNIDVRGHLLIWPGTGAVEDLDDPTAVSGVAYGNHLSNAYTSDFASYDVRGAVDTYRASARDTAAKAALESVVDAEITEWASQWDVYEWDVVNETLSNNLLQEILGDDQMAEWFNIAEANKVNPDADLFINEFQIVSAQFEPNDNAYEARRDTYFERIDQVIADNGPITGIGFQSRFKYGHIPPETVYARLQEYGTRYPNLKLAGTEFEIKDQYDDSTGNAIVVYDEALRAQMTEEILTTYYSHPNVTGMSAWDFMNPEVDADDPTTNRALCYYDGTVKLNGLVWYYLHRIRYNTDLSMTTPANGEVSLSGFKGDYAISVNYEGNDYPATYELLDDGSMQMQLPDVTVPPTEATIEHWPFDDVPNTQLADTLNVGGSVQFPNASPSIMTDGSGLLVVSQDASIASGGNFLGSSGITIGGRSKGVYELELIIASVVLTGGDANGANVGIGFKDSSQGSDLFRIRLNKTGIGLTVNTFFDSTYTVFHTFDSVYTLTDPLKLRAVIDLDSNSSDIYMALGAGAESLLGQIAIPPDAIWDQISFSAVNNSVDWGPNDVIKIDSMVIRKLQLDNYELWETRTNWLSETLTDEADDPDGDGIYNLMEYALGGDPILYDSVSILPKVSLLSGNPHLEFTLGVDSVDLRYFIQHSEDLIDWTSLPGTTVNGQIGDVVQIPLFDALYQMLFSRLRVSSH